MHTLSLSFYFLLAFSSADAADRRAITKPGYGIRPFVSSKVAEEERMRYPWNQIKRPPMHRARAKGIGSDDHQAEEPRARSIFRELSRKQFVAAFVAATAAQEDPRTITCAPASPAASRETSPSTSPGKVRSPKRNRSQCGRVVWSSHDDVRADEQQPAADAQGAESAHAASPSKPQGRGTVGRARRASKELFQRARRISKEAKELLSA